MTKQPSRKPLSVIAIYIFIAIFICLMIAGASFTAVSAFIILSGNVSVALPYFYLGAGLILAGYLVNVLLSYMLSGVWSWKLVSSKQSPRSK